ncbi:MAG: hypothetical protein KBT30_00595 [Clostridiales bacterium]|nr:hypothetical protein [Candidatus Apopatousia equi]
MANKITKKEMFLKLKGMVTDTDLIDFIDHEIELLEKKNGAKKKPSKNQVENANIKDTILNAMETDKAYSVSDIMVLIDTDLSNQRISALLTQLVNDNMVNRSVIKRKAYFTKA